MAVGHPAEAIHRVLHGAGGEIAVIPLPADEGAGIGAGQHRAAPGLDLARRQRRLVGRALAQVEPDDQAEALTLGRGDVVRQERGGIALALDVLRPGRVEVAVRRPLLQVVRRRPHDGRQARPLGLAVARHLVQRLAVDRPAVPVGRIVGLVDQIVADERPILDEGVEVDPVVPVDPLLPLGQAEVPVGILVVVVRAGHHQRDFAAARPDLAQVPVQVLREDVAQGAVVARAESVVRLGGDADGHAAAIRGGHGRRAGGTGGLEGGLGRRVGRGEGVVRVAAARGEHEGGEHGRSKPGDPARQLEGVRHVWTLERGLRV